MYPWSIPLLLSVCVACTKEGTNERFDTPPTAGRVRITNVQLAGSEAINELGTKADRLELYNPGPSIHWAAGEWYLTDNATKEPLKFELPELELHPHERLVIWCDGEDITLDEIHANFKLSVEDGTVRLTHLGPRGSTVVDEVDLEENAESN